MPEYKRSHHKKKAPSAEGALEILNDADRSKDMLMVGVYLLEEFGGPKGIAKEAKRSYDTTDSKTAKVRLFETVLQTIRGCLPKPTDNTDALSQLPTEDLQALFRDALGMKDEAEEAPPETPETKDG